MRQLGPTRSLGARGYGSLGDTVANVADPGGVDRLAADVGEDRADIIARASIEAARASRLGELAKILAQATPKEYQATREAAAREHEGIAKVIERAHGMTPPLGWMARQFYHDHPKLALGGAAALAGAGYLYFRGGRRRNPRYKKTKITRYTR